MHYWRFQGARNEFCRLANLFPSLSLCLSIYWLAYIVRLQITKTSFGKLRLYNSPHLEPSNAKFPLPPKNFKYQLRSPILSFRFVSDLTLVLASASASPSASDSDSCLVQCRLESSKLVLPWHWIFGSLARKQIVDRRQKLIPNPKREPKNSY